MVGRILNPLNGKQDVWTFVLKTSEINFKKILNFEPF